ncbi:hypothetical protein [Lysinibacillus sp. 54212]|uniref:hypothetical protein n=1 Tax=Lysinibacillus sp. 54212 TaxID=3119829 RepID=UPI002FCAA433
MSNNKTKRVHLLAAITLNGAIVEAGKTEELSLLSANALIAEGKAEEVAQEGTGGQQKGATELNEQNSGGAPKVPTEDELTLLRKALDDKYNRDPLAEEAKKVGVEFPYDAKKAVIIEAVIEAGKAEALLAE